MAKTTSITSVYTIRARSGDETVQVIQRVYRKFEKINGRVVQSELRPEIRDRSGRVFRRAGSEFRCVTSNELFELVEQAPSIRKENA